MSQQLSPITRLSLAAAVARVPLNVPQCSITRDVNEKYKTKPPEYSGARDRTPDENCKSNPMEYSGAPDPAANAKCKTKPPEHSGTSAEPRGENCEAKPPEHSGTSPLSYRQLAAARFLVRGHGSV